MDRSASMSSVAGSMPVLPTLPKGWSIAGEESYQAMDSVNQTNDAPVIDRTQFDSVAVFHMLEQEVLLLMELKRIKDEEAKEKAEREAAEKAAKEAEEKAAREAEAAAAAAENNSNEMAISPTDNTEAGADSNTANADDASMQDDDGVIVVPPWSVTGTAIVNPNAATPSNNDNSMQTDDPFGTSRSDPPPRPFGQFGPPTFNQHSFSPPPAPKKKWEIDPDTVTLQDAAKWAQKWGYELSQLADMGYGPEVWITKCIPLLERWDGVISRVVNGLMEDMSSGS